MRSDVTGLIVKEDKRVVALKGVSINTTIEEVAAYTEIIQYYINNEPKAIEAVFCFPVEESAAVCGLEIETGGRIIKGRAEEREKAFAVYDEAIAQGDGAFLLDRESGDLFYLSVGNIKPKQEVRVTIRYFKELSLADGVMELRIPSSFSPRYSPAGSDPLYVDRINPPVEKAVPYGLSLQVRLRAQGVQSVSSPSHRIRLLEEREYRIATLADEKTAMDRDFILEIEMAQQKAPTARIGRHENGEQAVLFRFYPEFSGVSSGERASEVIFLLDCSGSMSGSSIAEAKAALELSLRSLSQGDRFNIILFGTTYRLMSRSSEVYSEKSFSQALKFIQKIDADMGGTELAGAMSYICALPDPGEFTRDLILLTDGEISNPDEVIEMVAGAADKMRVFTFGIGYGASHHLVQGIARAGGGACEMIQPGEQIQPKVLRQFSRLTQPFFRDISFSAENMEVDWPFRLPPLFDGDSYTVCGKVRALSSGDKRIAVTGSYLGQKHTWECDAMEEGGSLIPLLWAVSRLRELKTGLLKGSRQQERKREAVESEITALGLAYNLVTEHTSFVAIETRVASEKNEGQPEFRRIPVCLTKDWHGSDGFELAEGGAAMGMADAAPMVMSPARAQKCFSSGLGGGMRSPKRSEKKKKESVSVTSASPWYIALLGTQEPAGYFTGMEIISHQTGREVNWLKKKAGELASGGGAVKEHILITALALYLLERDKAAKAVSRRAMAKAEKWLDSVIATEDRERIAVIRESL